MNKPVVLRLTPWQTRQLRTLFRLASKAASEGKHGIVAAQLYAPGDYAHGVGRHKVAVARAGWLRQEVAVHMTPGARKAVGKTDG